MNNKTFCGRFRRFANIIFKWDWRVIVKTCDFGRHTINWITSIEIRAWKLINSGNQAIFTEIYAMILQPVWSVKIKQPTFYEMHQLNCTEIWKYVTYNIHEPNQSVFDLLYFAVFKAPHYPLHNVNWCTNLNTIFTVHLIRQVNLFNVKGDVKCIIRSMNS